MQEEPLSIIKLDASSREAGAFKGADVLLLLQALNNAADGSLLLALWVKIDEKNRLSSDLNSKTSFSLIFINPIKALHKIKIFWTSFLPTFIRKKCIFS